MHIYAVFMHKGIVCAVLAPSLTFLEHIQLEFTYTQEKTICT